MSSVRSIRIEVAPADVLAYSADVLALKHAQSLFGADLAVYQALERGHHAPTLPEVGDFELSSTNGLLAAKRVLFLGVESLSYFGYPEIRDFARRVLATLGMEAPATRHLALTIHGPGYGLDEAEAFVSELAGLSDAVASGDFPMALDRITFVERDAGRAKRLTASLRRLLPGGQLMVRRDRPLTALDERAQATLRAAGRDSDAKPHVFVAMPFAETFDDTFHYGIQGAVHAAGFLCERADLSTFTGDVVDWVKRRIAGASFVVADLTTANPNVYLEVGYAWGCRVPTLLVIKDTAELKFDTRGHRCITYKTIKQLEEALRRELQSLADLQTDRAVTL